MSESGKGSTFTLEVPVELGKGNAVMDSHTEAMSLIAGAKAGAANPAP